MTTSLVYDIGALSGTLDSVSVELNAPARLTEQAELMLSAEERSRAQRFHFPSLRRRYVLSHACLRTFIGAYLRAEPRDLQFDCNKWGKPSVLGARLEFNLSHSGELAVYAFTADCPVGIDVEQTRPMPDILAIAERFFANDEFVDLVATEPARRETAFFRCWTRKESFIKALGVGLSHPLDRFRISLKPGMPALLSIDGDSSAALEWAFHDLHPAPGYIGSVAVRDPLRRLRVLPRLSASGVLKGEWNGTLHSPANAE